MSDWQPYFGDRLKLDHPHGFVVIKPLETSEPIPFECPVCHMLMHSSDDTEYFRQKSCCSKCGMKWADPNLPKWREGWRPSVDEVNDDVALRQQVPVVLNLGALGR